MMSAHHRPLDESDVMLIERVQGTPSLYDHRHADFRMQRKEEEWARVANGLNISVADAKRRWTCLRDRYSRELKQMRLHPSSEFGRNNFFRQMDFLRNFVRKRRERSRRDDTPTGWIKPEGRVTRYIKSQPETDTTLVEQQEYDESEHNYDAKLEVQTTQSESYSVLVEDEVHESYEDDEYMAEPEQKVLPTLQPAPAVVTVQTEAPITASSPETQPDINYMVCIPNVAVERDQLPTSKAEQLPTLEPPPPPTTTTVVAINENEDDFFCKSVAAYLRQLSRRHKIKAKVEMYQILEKYILIEETAAATLTPGHNS